MRNDIFCHHHWCEGGNDLFSRHPFSLIPLPSLSIPLSLTLWHPSHLARMHGWLPKSELQELHCPKGPPTFIVGAGKKLGGKYRSGAVENGGRRVSGDHLLQDKSPPSQAQAAHAPQMCTAAQTLPHLYSCMNTSRLPKTAIRRPTMSSPGSPLCGRPLT